MMKNHLSRKLAVILHADVVDSTALVQRDETLAHQCIQSAFQRFAEIISDYGGVAQEIRGDALVAEFERTSDAVSAALAFQASNNECNAAIDSEMQPWMRIGIGLGEVIVADGTITGAGVVLAQRLEQLAKPGGVCIQGAASETVPQRMPFEFESLGEKQLKGFDAPVRAFSVELQDGAEIPAAETITEIVAGAVEQLPRLTPNPGQPRILIMPFKNATGEEAQEFLASGITDNIIIALTAFRELLVFAYGTSMATSGLIESPADAFRELGADYVLEGKVQQAGNRVRVMARLVDARESVHLWAQNYDRDLADVFTIQDEISTQIVTSLVDTVEKTDLKRAQDKSPEQLAPYELVLKGRVLMGNYSREGILEARSCYQQAIDLNPNYAAAYSAMSVSYVYEFLSTWCESGDRVSTQIDEYANKALQLDNTDIMGHYSLALNYYWKGEYERAAAEIDHAFTTNPNDYHIVCTKGWVLTYSGQLQEGLELTLDAMRANPLGADFCLEIIGTGEYLSGNYDQALLAFSKIKSNGFHKLGGLAACYAQLDRMEEASRIGQQISAAVESDPQQQNWQDFWNRVYRFKSTRDREHFLEGMKKAGVLTET